MKDIVTDGLGAPRVVNRSTFQAEMDALRVREKAHTHEGDAIAAARRRLSMVEVDSAIPLIGELGAVTLLDAFEGRRMLIAYYFMWHTGHPSSEQCEGCTWVTSQVRELSYIHSRDVAYATFCQGPYEESARYRDLMGWEMPWYSASRESLEALLVERRIGRMPIICYLQKESKVFETYWTTSRSVEVMDNKLSLTRLDRLRPARDVGGFADRLAATVYLYADEQRLAHLATCVAGRTPDRSMAPHRGRAFGRPGNRRALNQRKRGLGDPATKESGMNIASKTILIIGANRGIRRALVEETLSRGAKRM